MDEVDDNDDLPLALRLRSKRILNCDTGVAASVTVKKMKTKRLKK